MISDTPGFWRGFRVGAAAGLVVGGIAFCTPARAEPFAQVTGPDRSTITLRTDKGPCLGDALLAVWQPEDASRTVPGCWVVFVREDGAQFVAVRPLAAMVAAATLHGRRID